MIHQKYLNILNSLSLHNLESVVRHLSNRGSKKIIMKMVEHKVYNKSEAPINKKLVF